MPQRIMGVDVGAWAIKAVVIEGSFRGFKVIDAFEIPVESGDPETRDERQISALQELLENENAKVDVAVAGVPGELATTRFISLPYSDPRKVEQTLGGELADNIPFDLDDGIFDHHMVSKGEDGSSLSVASIVQRQHVGNVLTILQSAGVDPKFLSVDSIQLYNLYTHFLQADTSSVEAPAKPSADAATFIGAAPGGPPEARLIVDIGHERTTVTACSEKGIAYTRVIRTGGAAITKAIAEAFELDTLSAEREKHNEGFIASSRHPPPSEEAQRMSDTIAKGLAPLVTDLRRSLMTIRREKRARIARVDLLGGGSRIRNLPNRIAEELNVPAAAGLAVEQIVEPHVDAHRRPAYATALAFALRAVGDEAVSPLDLRVGEFQYAGQLRYLRDRLPTIGLSAVALLFLMIVNVGASYHTVGSREAEIDREFCKITKKVIGREICEPKIAISAITQPTSELGNVRLPERSALNIAAELSEWIPEKLRQTRSIKVDEIDITPDRARISGVAPTFDAVDQIVAEYGKDDCYQNIKKGKLRKSSTGDQVEFQLTMRLECS